MPCDVAQYGPRNTQHDNTESDNGEIFYSQWYVFNSIDYGYFSCWLLFIPFLPTLIELPIRLQDKHEFLLIESLSLYLIQTGNRAQLCG